MISALRRFLTNARYKLLSVKLMHMGLIPQQWQHGRPPGDRGSYTSPTLPGGSYPFVNLREANTLLRKLFTSRKSEKNVRQHSGTQKGAIEAITSIHTGYMIRAPTFRRSTQRQEPHPLQLNTAAPQDLRSAGTAAFTRGRFFCAAATIRWPPFVRLPDSRRRGRKDIFMAFFNSAVDVLQTLVVALGAGLGIWGVINLMEGYGNDNPGANAHVR